jgi:Tfp pilus assembly protein PilO
MKIKTSTRISIIFSIFTFFVVLIVIIFLNIVSFFGWYIEEREEVELKLEKEYIEIKDKYKKHSLQLKEIKEDVDELNGVIIESNNINIFLPEYTKIIFEIFEKENKYFIIHKKETEF